MIPQPPKAAVVIRAGRYSGASLSWKMFEDTTPMRLANGTPTEVKTTRLFSSAMLLLYQTSVDQGQLLRQGDVRARAYPVTQTERMCPMSL